VRSTPECDSHDFADTTGGRGLPPRARERKRRRRGRVSGTPRQAKRPMEVAHPTRPRSGMTGARRGLRPSQARRVAGTGKSRTVQSASASVSTNATAELVVPQVDADQKTRDVICGCDGHAPSVGGSVTGTYVARPMWQMWHGQPAQPAVGGVVRHAGRSYPTGVREIAAFCASRTEESLRSN